MATLKCFAANLLILISALFSMVSFFLPSWSLYANSNVTSRIPGVVIKGSTTSYLGTWSICRNLEIVGKFETQCANLFAPYSYKDELGNKQSYPSVCNEWKSFPETRTKLVSYFLGSQINVRDGTSFFDKTCISFGNMTQVFSIIQMCMGLFALVSVILASCCCQNRIVHYFISLLAIMAGLAGIIASSMHAAQVYSLKSKYNYSVAFGLNTSAACFFLLAAFLLGASGCFPKKKNTNTSNKELIT